MKAQKENELREILRVRRKMVRLARELDELKTKLHSTETDYNNRVLDFCCMHGESGKVTYVDMSGTLVVVPPLHRRGNKPDPKLQFFPMESGSVEAEL